MKFAFFAYLPLATLVQFIIVNAPPLPLSVNPLAPLFNERQFNTTCGVGAVPLLPPSLNPFISPAA